MTLTKSKERIKKFGEVFTPPELVNEMLDKLDEASWSPEKTFLDNSCGNGNFLVAILERKLKKGHKPYAALYTIHGVELQEDNVLECRSRLKALVAHLPNQQLVDQILERNIVCADALKYHYRFDNSPPYDPEPVGKHIIKKRKVTV